MDPTNNGSVSSRCRNINQAQSPDKAEYISETPRDYVTRILNETVASISSCLVLSEAVLFVLFGAN